MQDESSRASLLRTLTGCKTSGRRIAALTAYDYPTARLLDEADIDLILVGDSLGMVVLGYEDTTEVTMDDMLHHTRACRRGVERAILAADLPFGSCDDPRAALRNARRLMEAGADCVKLEGGSGMAATIQTLADEGVPVIGHIGMLPQQVRIEGGYKKKGKTPAEAVRLLDDADAVQKAGAIAVVLESMVAGVAETITSNLDIPTIGIGAGGATDGQILVIHDLIGAYPWFRPSFATTYADVAGEITRSVEAYVSKVRAGG